ncbi:T9SS type B sorting domain-containing protein [Maribacter sp. X9]|uniref:T9SS type B sorting domain-containing protein n=1 Tax=Maribacter sp. X9 TaxID=3402159 RepID=UPI003AF3AA9D
MRKQYTNSVFFIFFLMIGAFTAMAQVKTDFEVRYEADIRGELTVIANNIVNRKTSSSSPNAPHNLTGTSSNYNDDYDMQYIDIDNDSNTFSSSSAILSISDPDCSVVRYAGLYWSAIYKNTDRSTIDDIKFKLPGGVYQDITADEIIFDGDGDVDFGYYSPYAAYKDVTSMVAGLSSPAGEYFVANVRASTGNSISGGISGGWQMVVVYENPNLPGSKFITTFDGYAGIKSGESVDIPVSGFTTLPAPFPVYAHMGVAALEGDNRIGGDALQINANGSFTTLSNGQNPANNFFNSSITINDTQFTARTPNSVNTLGWDVDFFEILNGGSNNTVIPNGATSAILRATSSQDKYDIFFTSFDVDIIAPNIVLEKRVNTPGGDDITGQGVHLGQTLDYVLTFENIGNDDGVNYTIKDVLPVNVSPPDGRSFFNASDFTLPPGVTYTYDTATREIVFNIPNELVTQEATQNSIRFRVQVAENCFDFINACSDLIENIAFGTYSGVENSAVVNDDPSVTDFNACGYTVPGATNFLLDDLSDCNFERTVELCGNSAVLNAGDGFDSYVWYRDTNNNGIIDATDVEINDGDPDNDPSTIVVTTAESYIVDKIVADPCKGFTEIITVVPYGSGTIPNPIIEYFNEVNNDTDPSNNIPGEIVSCSVDSSLLPKIFLCGINDSHLLQVNIVDAQTVNWEKLDEGSCSASGDDCANKALTCTWNQVGTGGNYRLNAPGQYRLSVTYQNGCTSRFYFNGFQNNLDLQFNKRDIICDTDGNITITNLGNGYGYQLVNDLTNDIIVPFSADNGPSFNFASGQNGSYRVEVTPLDVNGDPIENACVFTTPVIGILERAVTYNVDVTNETCHGLGTVTIQISNAESTYEYELRRDDGTNGGSGTLVDSENGQSLNYYSFTGLSAGNYIASVRTADGCSYTENVTVIDENNLDLSARVSQHIICKEGNILMDSSGGKTPHTYAIWSYVDESGNTVTSYPSFADIPASNFGTSQIFDIVKPGDYTFVVLDRNGCYAVSNTVTIELRPASEFTSTTVYDVACYGESSGAIEFNLVNDNGYQLTYYLFDNTNFDENSYDYNNALATNASGYFPNLSSGDYAVVINQRKGSASCDYYEYHTLSEPTSGIFGEAFLVQEYTCLQDGIIEARNVTGGAAPYAYSLDGINFTADSDPNANRFENLIDGTYRITIRDASGCIFKTDPIIIDGLNPPSDLNVVQSQIVCPSETASLTVTSIKGTAPFVYEIVAPSSVSPSSINDNDANFDNLSPDTYTIRVTDADGCFYEENYTIDPIVPITMNATTVSPITCFGADNGELRFNITYQGGQNFSYVLTGPSGTIRSGGTQPVIDNIVNLAPGDYTLDLTETNTGCTFTYTYPLVGPSSALTVSNIAVTQPTCLVDGSASVTASGGWGGYSYSLNNPDNSLVGTNTTGNFSGLTQNGTFTGTVTDANNCIVPFTFALNAAIAPDLEIVPNSFCYDDAVGLTLTANIVSGGDGNFEYNLNGGTYTANNTFSGLVPGTYTIYVRDGKNCMDSESITIYPELKVQVIADNIAACETSTEIDITAAGGDGKYVYAVVLDGVAPSNGDFSTTNPVTVSAAGDYDIFVRDKNGLTGFCEVTYDISIQKDTPLSISVGNTPVLCSGDNQSTLTINPSGGRAPYRYSINNGSTYQTSNTFNNLGAGNYQIRVRDFNNCEVAQTYSITEPFTLSASAAVTQLAECNPGMGAEVRVTNPQGGTAPYTYSFDGGVNYTLNAIDYLLPGTHTVFIKDANNCTFPMTVVIEQAPTPPNVTLTPSIDYSCDGTGIVSISPDDPNLKYTYAINGIANSPADSNVFTNVPVGTHTITVDYLSNTAPTPSTLLLESFGTGANTSITQIDPAYCYEAQDGTASSCGFGTDTHIQDGEYSVTQTIVNPYGSWRNPNDHSGDVNGRFLAINVGGVAGVGGIIYAKRDIEVIPNRDISVSLWAFNLLRTGTSGGDPTIEIQLVDGSGNIIASTATGNVPKNSGANDWHNYSVNLNPGANSDLDIVIRTNSAVVSGNDIAIDDIEAYQLPEQCSQTVSMDVTVEDGNALEASITSTADVNCSGDSTGSITFEVDNFGAGGFEYSLDNFVSILGTTTVSPQTISGLSTGNYTIYIRDVDNPTADCTVSVSQTITEPTPVEVVASVTNQATCTEGGKITASASGGTPYYEYQLEDDLGGIISGYDYTTNGVNTSFSDLAPGNYIVRARDINGCEDSIDTALTIDPANPIVFTATATTCYSGANDGEIQINVTNGNGGYQFRLNGGTWVSPATLTSDEYTYTGLSSGSYTVEVRDAFGCPLTSNSQTLTINPQLTAEAVLTNDLSCLVDAMVTINANGGSGTYTYEWSDDNGLSYYTTNFSGNVFTTSNFGTFMFRVSDTTNPTACTVVTDPVQITEAETPIISNVTPKDIFCNGELTGSLDVTIDTSVGLPPYTINVVETNGPTNYGTQTNSLPAGDYEVTITDDKGCVSAPFTVSIAEPSPITYVTSDVPITCNSGTGSTNPGEISITGVSGGTAEYTYVLTGNNGIATQTYVTTPSTRDHVFTVLEFGIYQIDVVDANGCASFTTEIIASPPNDLDIDVSTVTTDCTAGGTAIVTVSSAVGSGNYEFGILDSFSPPYASSYQNPDAPGGYTATFASLTPGVLYTFVVFDATTNCYYFEEAAAPVNTPSNMTASLDAINNVSCTGAGDGNISFTFSGFNAGATQVQYEIFNRQSNLTTGFTATSAVNPPSTVTINNFATLPPGEYYLLLTEVGGPNNGCSVDGGNFTIRESVNALDLDVASPKNDNCNLNAGVITASGRFGTAPYEYQYLNNSAPAPGANDAGWISNTSANVEAGDYIVYVKDAYGCIFQRPITVDEDLSPSISLSIIDECVEEGMFEVVVTLNNPVAASSPFQLSVNGSAFHNFSFDGSNQYTLSGLHSGLGQTFAVRDLNGCVDTQTLDIQKPLEFTVVQTVALDCETGAAANAEILINVVSGSGNYEFKIDGPGTSDQSRTVLPPSPYTWTGAADYGNYYVTVFDLGTTPPNCFKTITIAIPDAPVPAFTKTETNVSCNGLSDGSVTLTETNTGINPLTYVLTPMPAGAVLNGTTFENLPPGTYSVRGTGTNNCSTNVDIVITEPTVITVPQPTVVPFACTAGNNGNNASITIDGTAITGGSGNYVRYEFIEEDDPNTVPVESPVVVQNGANPKYIETNTDGGKYTINVYDSTGCLGTTTAIIPPFDAITSATATVTNTVTCNPGNDGELTMNVNSTLGDATKFEYSIDNGANYQTYNVFGVLEKGTYTILARHLDTGCMISATQTLLEPNTFTIDVQKTSDVVCFGSASGAVNFTLVDTTYPGGFTWMIYDTKGTPADISDDVVVDSGTETTNATSDINLPVGSYYISVSQDNNPFCQNTEAFTITGPSAAITGAIVVNDITCAGSDGSIKIINVAGGWGSYTYYIGVAAPSAPSDYSASPSLGGLSAETYQAWVRDAQGCEQLIQDNIVLADPTPINATLQVKQENCTNLQGILEVINVNGGQGSNYTYQLILNGSNFRAPQNTSVFSGLGAGSYEVEVTDQWGCSFTTPAEVLYEEMNLTTTVDKTIDCTSTPGGQITVNVTGGPTNLEFEMTVPGGTIITQTTGVFTNLVLSGTYSFVVKDLDTTNPVCERTIVQNLDAPVAPLLLDASLTHVSCFGGNDGSIRANIDPTTKLNPVYRYELYEIGNLSTPILGPSDNPLFTGLSAGDYQVKIISARGCEAVKNETITQPTQLLIDAVATEFSCSPNNSVNTATVTVSILNGATTPGTASGTSPYLYSLDNINFQSSNTFNITDTGAAQTVNVFVTDGKGCTATDMVTIQPINRFTASVTTDVDISCANAESVTITVSDNGLTHNYTYELLPIGNTNALLTGTTAATATFDLITTGSYTFRVTDTDTGCYYDTTAYNVEPYDFIRATATAVTPVTCFGDTNGEVEINIIGYTGTYQYEVFDTTGNSVIPATASDTNVNPRRFGGLSGGNYYVTITETATPFCSDNTNIITIDSPDINLTAAVNVLAEPTCTNQGEIRIVPVGGYSPYAISMTNGTDTYDAKKVQSIAFSGLAAGTYTITVTDDKGCIRTYTEILNPATKIVANATPLITDLACFGDTGATVSANVISGGSGSYEYQLNYYDEAGTSIEFTTGQQLSPNFNDLGAGFYSITVSDGWNCDVTTDKVEVKEPTPVEAFLRRTDPLTCATGAEFELTATGGSGSYEYMFIKNESSNGVFLLMTSNPLRLPETGIFQEGTYQYYVRDAVNGCEAAVSNVITENKPMPLILTVDKTSAVLNCTGESTAIIYANAEGGLGNYQYELFTDSSLNLATRVAGPLKHGIFRNLSAGTYYVSVTSEDCTTQPVEVIINPPTPLSYTESVLDVTCAGEDNGRITVELSGGAGGYQYAISPNLNQFTTINTFTDLSPGEYTVIAQDKNGCFEYLTYTITEPTILKVSANSTPEICVNSQDGSIILEISGGTAPYSTALNANDDTDFVPNRTDFFDLAAGNYLLFIRDSNGCETNVVVDIERGVNLNAIIEPIYECTGYVPNNYVNITLEDDSVIGDVLYALDSVDPSDFQLNPDFRNSAPGNHYITIAHANGCIQTIDFVIEAFDPLTLSLEQLSLNQIIANVDGGKGEYTYYFDGIDNGSENTFYIDRTDTFEVRVVDANGCEAVATIFMEFIDIEIPNFFTPDGDTKNDFWIPKNMEQFPKILIKIFDRYGRVVSNQSVDSKGWDGMYSGNELPTGDYWYIIKLNGERDEREFVGHFTLYR